MTYEEARDLLQSNPQALWEYLKELATVVQRKHYSKHYDPEDLISEATLKGYEMVSSNLLQGDYRSFRSYLYTGMRNCMSNKVYHDSKESVPLDDISYEDIYASLPQDFVPNSVEEVLKDFPSQYSIYKPLLSGMLQRIIIGERVELFRIPPSLKERNVERLLVLTIWKLRSRLVC